MDLLVGAYASFSDTNIDIPSVLLWKRACSLRSKIGQTCIFQSHIFAYLIGTDIVTVFMYATTGNMAPKKNHNIITRWKLNFMPAMNSDWK